VPLPILIYLHVYFFTLKTPDPMMSPSKVLILETRPSVSSKKRVGWRVKRTRMWGFPQS